MKNMFKHTALGVSLLAGIQLILGELVRAGLFDVSKTTTEWIGTFSRLILMPDPTITLWILIFSLGIWVILSSIKGTKRKVPSLPTPLPPPTAESFPPRGSLRQKYLSQPRPSESPTIAHRNPVMVEEEWNKLEEAEKEVIRAIASQEGLWETDIIALLETRGFLQPKGTLESLAERVSFVNSDYAGYHSIPPEYQAQLVSVLANENAEDSF